MNLLSLRQSLTTLLTEIQKLLFQTIGTTVTTATIANICIRLSSGIKVGNKNSTEKWWIATAIHRRCFGVWSQQAHFCWWIRIWLVRSALWRYGYAFKGQLAVADKLLIRGKHYSVISIMSIDGSNVAYCPSFNHSMEGIPVVLW